MTDHDILALTIFALTYFAIAGGRFPSLRLDRAGAAFVGAVAMVLTRVLTGHEALMAIDFHTIALLLGMMIVVAYLRVGGTFSLAGDALLRQVKSGYGLLAMTVMVSGVLAAFFINDVVCLALTPLVIDTAEALDANPIPYLLAVVTASNVGSVATITGNPQNMIVAGFANLGYLPFAIHLAPVAAGGLAIIFGVIAIAYRADLRRVNQGIVKPPVRRVASSGVMIKSAVVACATLVMFMAGYPVHLVALGAAAVMLVTRRVKPARIYALIDWTTLMLFVGLFIVVAGAQSTGLPAQLVKWIGVERMTGTATLAIVSAVLSNIVSNVPAVLLFRPLFPMLGAGEHTALVLASSSTLAGNLTVVGSIANLIVIEAANRRGVRISFYEYLRVGVPITILTLAGDILFLSWWR